ncbi:MAG TPA: GNAT family N-acetyltransferase [Gaiellaceae bacterium]|nr:GNAT family N-acetyltransferase [Gaiellaceae bacterium]
MLRIELPNEPSDELVDAFRRLIPQLSASAAIPDADEVNEIVSSPATTVLAARTNEGIVGLLTLALFRAPSGLRAWIEDVVVDEAARGRGAGEALTREAVRLAGERGARTVDLTSRPSREAANRMYEKVGFRKRETNVYRYELASLASGSL